MSALYLYGSGGNRPDKHHVFACREIVNLLRPGNDTGAIRDLYHQLNPER